MLYQTPNNSLVKVTFLWSIFVLEKKEASKINFWCFFLKWLHLKFKLLNILIKLNFSIKVVKHQPFWKTSLQSHIEKLYENIVFMVTSAVSFLRCKILRKPSILFSIFATFTPQTSEDYTCIRFIWPLPFMF